MWLRGVVLIALGNSFCVATKPPGYVEKPKIPDPNPPDYRFSYAIADIGGASQGHQESRQGEHTDGRYFLQIPQESTKHDVQYHVDDWGYHPLVQYSSSNGHSSSQTRLAFGEKAVAALNQHSQEAHAETIPPTPPVLLAGTVLPAGTSTTGFIHHSSRDGSAVLHPLPVTTSSPPVTVLQDHNLQNLVRTTFSIPQIGVAHQLLPSALYAEVPEYDESRISTGNVNDLEFGNKISTISTGLRGNLQPQVGISKLVASTQSLVSNEDLLSINNAEEEVTTKNLFVPTVPTVIHTDDTFVNPIIVPEVENNVVQTVVVTPRPVSQKFLAPLTAGLALVNANHGDVVNCLDTIDNEVSLETQHAEALESSRKIQENLNEKLYKEGAHQVLIHPQGQLQQKLKEEISQQSIEKSIEHESQHYRTEVIQQPAVLQQEITITHYGNQNKDFESNNRNIRYQEQIPAPQQINYNTYPVAVPVPVHFHHHVPVDRIVEKIVEKKVQIPVHVKVPYPVEKIVNRPVLVEKKVPVPVPVTVSQPYAYPYPVQNKIPYAIPYPIQVPYPQYGVSISDNYYLASHQNPVKQWPTKIPIYNAFNRYSISNFIDTYFGPVPPISHTNTWSDALNFNRNGNSNSNSNSNRYVNGELHLKLRRNFDRVGRNLNIEYGGFKPPLIPSIEIDLNGIPVNSEKI